MSSPGIKIHEIFLEYLYAISALLQKPCCDLPLIHFDHALVFQLPDLPEHGAPVHTQVIRQSGARKGNGEHSLLGVIRTQIKIAQQTIPDGAAAQHLHPFTEPQRLFGNEPEQIFRDLGVAGAGVAASLGDLIVGDEADLAVRVGGYIDGVLIAGKSKTFTEQSALLHPFQNGTAAVFIGADQGRHALEDDADSAEGLFIVTDHGAGRKICVGGVKALHHPLAVMVGNIFKQGNIAKIQKNTPEFRKCCNCNRISFSFMIN